jgi:hypothetical protein
MVLLALKDRIQCTRRTQFVRRELDVPSYLISPLYFFRATNHPYWLWAISVTRNAEAPADGTVRAIPGTLLSAEETGPTAMSGYRGRLVTAGAIIPLYRGHNGIWDIDSTIGGGVNKAGGQGD